MSNEEEIIKPKKGEIAKQVLPALLSSACSYKKGNRNYKPNYRSIVKNAFAVEEHFIACLYNKDNKTEKVLSSAEEQIGYEVIINWSPEGHSSTEHSGYKFHKIVSIDTKKQTVTLKPIDNPYNEEIYNGDKKEFEVNANEIKFIKVIYED